MGAGKTTIGRLVAKQLGKTFIDSDHEIEEKTGVKIPIIFDLEGEEGFRKRESLMIESLCERDNIVLATGGGAVLKPENRKQLKEHGTVIYLHGKVHDLWLRTRHDRSRPLLQGDNSRKTLETLYAARHPIYSELADYTFQTGKQSANEIVQRILKAIA